VGRGNGNLLVGQAYTAMLDLKPGDTFEIKLGRKPIKLIPAGSAEKNDSAAGAVPIRQKVPLLWAASMHAIALAPTSSSVTPKPRSLRA
jgi:hypothetical protein